MKIAYLHDFSISFYLPIVTLSVYAVLKFLCFYNL